MRADHARDGEGAAGVRAEADADESLKKLGVFGREDEIAAEGQIRRAASTSSADGTEDEFRHFFHLQDEFGKFPGEGRHGFFGEIRLVAMRFHETDVAAGGKRASGAGQNDDFDGVIRFGDFQRVFDFERHFHVEGVQRRRVVERQCGDAAVCLVMNSFVLHGEPPFLNEMCECFCEIRFDKLWTVNREPCVNRLVLHAM